MKKYTITLAFVFSFIFTSCVQQEHQKEVTIAVDMNDMEAFESIGIRGNFLPSKWRETVPMTDEDKDGIYTITFQRKTAAYGIEFKFVKNGNEFELKDQDNRAIVFEYRPETIEYTGKFNNNKDIKINRK